VELGILTGRADVTAAIPAIATFHDEIAVLVVAREELVEAVQNFAAVGADILTRAKLFLKRAVFVDLRFEGGESLGLIKQIAPFLVIHSRLDAKFAFNFF